MRKCRGCLCRTCIKVCCNRKECPGKKRDCVEYREFRQLGIFGSESKPKYQKAPRYSWDYYGITKERYMQLTEHIQSGRYTFLAHLAAHTANEMIAEYLLLSVTKKLSYEALEGLWGYGEIERIPCGRSDFYGIRRYFFSIFNEKMKEIGK